MWPGTEGVYPRPSRRRTSTLHCVSRERFTLALRELAPAQWEVFEGLASDFLASEFPDLRTMASSSGDKGRDAQLWATKAVPLVVLQYSVRTDWDRKIMETAERLGETFPDARVLIYATNQAIGAKADDLRSVLTEKHSLFLDVRDRAWFVERQYSSPTTEAAAEHLCEIVVDPLLRAAKVVEGQASSLTSDEARAAVVYLNLQLEDDSTEKGLTKLSFDALVRAVLRDTSPENLMPREEVQGRVAALVPSRAGTSGDVKRLVDSALDRLAKKYIRHHQKDDSFCLTYTERDRLQQRLLELEERDSRLSDSIVRAVEDTARIANIPSANVASLGRLIRQVVEEVLLDRGEAFVQSLESGQLDLVDTDRLRDIIVQSVAASADDSALSSEDIALAVLGAESLLLAPPTEVVHYLQDLSITYTLFAFLRETPDIQRAVVKIFSGGQVWLDTTVVLPLFVEELLEPSDRQYTNLLRAAKEAGLSLRITEGVLEEVDGHLNRSRACSSTTEAWQGRIPFVFSLYTMAGRPRNQFGSWLESFRGSKHPEDDIANYLAEEHGIRVASLADVAATADEELSAHVREYWRETQQRRRGRSGYDPGLLDRLADHDVENYVGVIQKRREERAGPLGYQTWWLTLDRAAFGLAAELRNRMTSRVPDSPLLSPDFLLHYLSVGPIRRMVSQQTHELLPVIIPLHFEDFMDPVLLEKADEIRAHVTDKPERVVRRQVRDALEALKLQRGPLASEGIQGTARAFDAAVQSRAQHQ